ncbi:hypothetical protein [Embleya sp. NPDC001921]
MDRQSEAKATPPEVDSERLALVLRDTYAKPGTSTWRGNGKASAALAHELGTGERTGNDRFHAVDVADLLGRYHKLLRHDRTLTERDHLVAVTESTELWSALQAPDEAGAITRWLLGNPARVRTVLDVADRVRRDPDLAPATGSRFEASPYGRRTLIAAAPLRGLLRDLGAARRGRGAAPPATAGLDPTRIAAAGRPTSSRSPIEPGDGRPGPAAAPAQPHRRRERPGPEPGS